MLRRASSSGIPLLLPVEPGETAEGIRARVVDRQVAVLHVQEEQVARVARLAAQLESAPEHAPARLAQWLDSKLEREAGSAALVSSGSPPGILAGNATAQRAYVQVRNGRVPTAHVPGPSHVLLHPAGAVAPYDVLLAVSEREWTPHQVALTRHTAHGRLSPLSTAQPPVASATQSWRFVWRSCSRSWRATHTWRCRPPASCRQDNWWGRLP